MEDTDEYTITSICEEHIDNLQYCGGTIGNCFEYMCTIDLHPCPSDMQILQYNEFLQENNMTEEYLQSIYGDYDRTHFIRNLLMFYS